VRRGIAQFNDLVDACAGDLAAGDDDRAERPPQLVSAITA
jgi:hypothetical protein